MPFQRERKNGPTVLQLSMMRPAATVTAVNTTPIGPIAKRRATPTRRSPPERIAAPAAQTRWTVLRAMVDNVAPRRRPVRAMSLPPTPARTSRHESEAKDEARCQKVSVRAPPAAASWAAFIRSSTPPKPLAAVRSTLRTRPRATPPTASVAMPAPAPMTTPVRRGKRRARSRTTLRTDAPPSATAPTTGSSAVPTVTPRLWALCVTLASEVAVVFIRLAYS